MSKLVLTMDAKREFSNASTVAEEQTRERVAALLVMNRLGASEAAAVNTYLTELEAALGAI